MSKEEEIFAKESMALLKSRGSYRGLPWALQSTLTFHRHTVRH